jgi:hypothetical protein
MAGLAADSNVKRRVARWNIFKPKIPIWVYFLEGLGIENILWPFGIFDIQYLIAIWYILWSFGIFVPVLVYCM